MGGAAVALQEGCGKEVSQGGAAVSSLESEKTGLWGQVQGVSLGRDELLLPTVSLVASLVGSFRV